MIGIGAGDPEHVTAQAIRALNAVDVFFVVEKGQEKHDLVDLRREICERYIESPSYRTVELPDPERDRASPAYGEAVEAWRHARAEQWEAALRAELGGDECGAFLVWGDPALYDSTLAVVEEILARGELELDYEVVPGISSVAGARGPPPHLAQSHRAPDRDHDRAAACRGSARRGRRHRRDARRRLRVPALCRPARRHLLGRVHRHARRAARRGRRREVADEIERVRAEARERKGWIMDTYLLRRRRLAG